MARPIRLLLVEDSEDDTELLLIELREQGYEPEYRRVDNAGALHEALQEDKWDLVVCDYNLPGFSASAALAILQEHHLDLPFLLVSGTVPEGAAVAAMKSGARDYIMKGNLARLAPAIERELDQATERRTHRRNEEERERLQALMGMYLHPKVAGMVAESPDLLRLGGEKRQLTVMFTDLRGFSSAAEVLEPEVLVDVLSEYLESMTDIIFAHGGLLDKYMGDGIMALWGAPVALEDHAIEACRAALDMVSKQRELCLDWLDRGLPPLQMGVGINTGPVVVGNLGSSRRFAYTALGDHVNLGSRIEQLNKLYGTHILISEYTRNAIGDEFLLRPLDLVRVKGKQTAVQVFELMGAIEDAPRIDGFTQDFEQALAAYRSQNWQDAFGRFAKLATVMPEDGPTRLYVERCLAMLHHPPGSNWDGVYLAEGI